jgi:hypothetical protein
MKKLLCFLAAAALLSGCDKPAAPQKWEYKTVELYNDSLQGVKEALALDQGPVQNAYNLKIAEEFENGFSILKYDGCGKTLVEAGEDGWELVSAVPELQTSYHAGDSKPYIRTEKILLLFKRQKS